MSEKTQLNPSQKKALDCRRNIIISAGAGSGKTRVLVERFLWLFLNDPSLSIENVVAITFTDKAAAELRGRVRERLGKLLSKPQPPNLRKRILSLNDELTRAYIGTIHSFCRRLLGEFPLEARVDAGFSVLEETDSARLLEEAIDETLTKAARRKSPPLTSALRFLLRHLRPAIIQNILTLLIRRRDIASDHIERYLADSEESLIAFERKSVSHIGREGNFDEAFERINVRCLKALASLYQDVAHNYEARKGFGTSLDFDDLLLRASALVENNKEIREKLRHRFRYILVDEFQDTDPVQWKLFRLLTGERNPGCLFIVGDPKQSIYGFRRADVRLFYAAQDFILKTNRAAQTGLLPLNAEDTHNPASKNERLGLLELYENYRSVPAILDFANFFFSHIMENQPSGGETFEVAYEPLIAQNPEAPGGVEFILADTNTLPQENPFSNLPREDLEAELIALRIKQILKSDTPDGFAPGDVALLLRSRTHLKAYEAALERHNIPYVTVGGIGFYERQEIYDIANLLQFLVSPENDPALLGLLRSPYLRISDELLFCVAQNPGRSLWERLTASLNNQSISETDKMRLSSITELLKRFHFEAQRKPLSILLKDFLTQTGGWTSLAADDEGRRARENMEKLLALARQFDASGFQSLIDFSENLFSLIENAEREGEAPSPIPDENAVRIMTIHKAKGLEFPVVVLPGLSSRFNFGNPNICLDKTYGLAIKPANPASDFIPKETALFSSLREREKDKQRAEEKRLFYVGATRAEKILILALSATSKRVPDSRRTWLEAVFPISDAFKNSAPLHYEIDGRTGKITIHRTPETITPPLLEKTTDEDVSERLTLLEDAIRSDSQPESLDILLPLPQKETGRRFAVTQLMALERCPVHYYVRYILGLKEENLERLGFDITREIYVGEEVVAPKSWHLLRGTITHCLLQEMPFQRGLTAGEIISSLLQNDTTLTPEERKSLCSELLDTWSVIEKREFIKHLALAKERHSELPFRISFGKDTLQGRVDLCIRDKAGLWSVVDFKTGQISPGDVDSKARAYSLQMDAYALCLSAFAPEQKCLPIKLYFTEPDKFFTREYNRSAVESARKRIGGVIKRERDFRQHYASKGAHYGRSTVKKLLSEECHSCARLAIGDCNLKNELSRLMKI